MKHKNGFTLMEVLLAVMIVAIIGVALASLMSAASRETNLGNSKIILRNNLSHALRIIRNDVQSATGLCNVSDSLLSLVSLEEKAVTYCFEKGEIDAAPNGAKVGGKIYRLERANCDALPESCAAVFESNDKELLLGNVKYLKVGKVGLTGSYEVPKFSIENFGTVSIQLILEVPGSKPPANEATEQVFFLPSSFH